MNTKTSDNQDQEKPKFHPLVQVLFENGLELAEVANNVNDAWQDPQKDKFYDQVLRTYAKEYDEFKNRTTDIIIILEKAEEMANDLKKPFAGMGTTVLGVRLFSFLEINTVARREFSKLFNRDGWGS